MNAAPATAPRKIPARFVKRYESLMAFNARTASPSANERNRKAWETLRRDVVAAGFEMADLY